ncbi:hypothetical protein, partial [Arthrobacter sp. JCM 19049]|uniref:hypothetical protein n=1 Tax=Arthrobacter sp. JCM 19049 TaxID=1460643 RepID=UPI0024362C4C
MLFQPGQIPGPAPGELIGQRPPTELGCPRQLLGDVKRPGVDGVIQPAALTASLKRAWPLASAAVM